MLWVCVTNPLRHLECKSSALNPYSWTGRHNSKVIDAVEKAMLEIIEDSKSLSTKNMR